MKDYKELIEQLHSNVSCNTRGLSRIQIVDDFKEALAAIEALIAERDTLMSEIHGKCDLCVKYEECWHDYEKKRQCVFGGYCSWEWRGAKRGEG